MLTKFKMLMLNVAVIVSLVSATAFVIHVWQARAHGNQVAPTGGMSSFIRELHSNGHADKLPVQVVEHPY